MQLICKNYLIVSFANKIPLGINKLKQSITFDTKKDSDYVLNPLQTNFKNNDSFFNPTKCILIFFNYEKVKPDILSIILIRSFLY